MFCKILILSLFAVCIKADMALRIPCVADDTCKAVLNPSLEFRCIHGGCMCVNPVSKSYQFCSAKDIIVTARHQVGLRRDCSHDGECDHIDGAKCYKDESDEARSRKVCDCQSHMVMSADGNKCLSVANEPGARCTESVQCTAKLDGAECSDGRCKCRPTFHFAQSKKRCILNKVYGETCVREEESCFQLSGTDGKNVLGCSDKNICKCVKNYVYVDGMCQHSDASRIIFDSSLVIMMVMFAIRLFS